MNLQKIIGIVVILIGVLGLIFWGLLLNNIDPWTNILINMAKILVIIAAAAALIFTIINVVSDSKKLMGALKAIGGFLLVGAISYFLATGEATETASASTNKWIETGLYMFYLLTFVAAAIMLFFGIKKTLLNK